MVVDPETVYSYYSVHRCMYTSWGITEYVTLKMFVESLVIIRVIKRKTTLKTKTHLLTVTSIPILQLWVCFSNVSSPDQVVLLIIYSTT